MSTPAVIWCVLAGMSAVAKCFNHGKAKTENALVYLFLDLPVAAGLLYWGGFFS